MRTQYCREHIDKTAEECGLEYSTVQEVKQAAEYVDKYSDMSDCSTRAILALIRLKDDVVREKAQLAIKKALETRKEPGTGRFLKDKHFTEKQVRQFITLTEDEIRKAEDKERTRIDTESTKASEEIAEKMPDVEAMGPVKITVSEIIRMMVDSECAAAEEGARNQDPEALIEGRMAPKNSLEVTYVQQIVGFLRRPGAIENSALGEGKKKIATLILTSRDGIVGLKCTIKERLIQRDAIRVKRDQILDERKRIRAELREIEKKLNEHDGRMKSLDSEIRGIESTIERQGERIIKLCEEFTEAKE